MSNGKTWARWFKHLDAAGAAPGRRAIDPRVLFALWLYATLDGVGSGREVARLTRQHDAYRWICGGVSVNYHALNDFRCGNERVMDELLTANVATLAAVGAIGLQRVAQDGMRVRADAGAASFRRQGRLEEHLVQASELVQTLKVQAESDRAKPTGAQAASGVQPNSAKHASATRCNNCPKWPRPSGATPPSPRTRAPAPPMPMPGS
jgi:transposase